MKPSDITKAFQGATGKWAKMRKREERGSRLPRDYEYSNRVYFTEVADEILPDAYQHASGNGQYSASHRQIYYACRDEFYKWTGRQLSDQYFRDTLLRQFMNRNKELTRSWKVTADPRGTLTIPNAGHEVRIPCGTIAIEDHLRDAQRAVEPFEIDAGLPIEWPSIAPNQRYQAVVYIEKEGFEPQLREARIAERFDVAILSCKGQSVVAARRFVDKVCRVDGGVPLLVVHDLDKAGFEIAQRLTQVSDWAIENDRVAYDFQNEIKVHDLGLRITDVKNYNLASVSCRFKGRFAPDSIATEEEREFLRSGKRIELNPFTSPQFIEWIEAKLAEHLSGKRLIPNDNDVLAGAFRRALTVAKVNAAIEEVVEEAIEDAEETDVADGLRSEVAEMMRANPDLAWDRALYNIARQSAEADG